MRERLILSTALLLLLLLLSAFVGSNEVGGVVVAKMGCGGKVGGCIWEEEEGPNEGLEEMEMDSNANRRILWGAAQKRYISYEALKNDVVPCARTGVPYYNCRVFPRATNLYSRGCEIITACARDAVP